MTTNGKNPMKNDEFAFMMRKLLKEGLTREEAYNYIMHMKGVMKESHKVETVKKKQRETKSFTQAFREFKQSRSKERMKGGTTRMPINRNTFEKGGFERRHTNRDEHPVAVLLKKNMSLAFTAQEIANRTKMNEDTVRSMLAKLREEGHIVHKTPYFAWKK